MRKIDINELKRVEINILDYVADFCNKNGITYYLDGGTLLGAIRHKGFIPWDDDIDIAMPRKDYDRFVHMCLDDSRYKILSYETDEKYIYSFAKVVDSYTKLKEWGTAEYEQLGVYIDVFPIDALPDNGRKRRLLQKKVWHLRKMQAYSIIKNRGYEKLYFKLIKKIAKIVGSRRWLYLINNNLHKYDMDKESYCADIASALKRNICCNKNVFDTGRCTEFEGKMYNIPNNAEEYLSELYGDYMTLPPENERVSHHKFEAYYIYEEE